MRDAQTISDSTFLYGGNIFANGIRQHYLRFGGKEKSTEEPIILIPGITSPAATWAFVGERLGQHFDTYILDVRGRGLSSAGDDLDYSLNAQAADVLAFAQALGISRYSLLGHSMGARIGAREAAAKLSGATQLVMIDPPVSGPGRRPYPGKLSWYLDSICAARLGTDAEGMRPFCPTWTDAQLRLRAEWLHTCDQRAVTESFLGFQTDDFHFDLARVNVPIFLVTAGRGDVVRKEELDEMLDLVPTMKTACVPDAGHMIPWDDEEGFYKSLGSFLGSKVSS